MKLFQEQTRLIRFEQIILPHLAAAYNLARWLTRNDQDAEDLVQEAYLRAFKFFDSFQGDDGRKWLLTIVRNTFYSRLSQQRRLTTDTAYDEELHDGGSEAYNPEKLVLQNMDKKMLEQALEELPLAYREVIVLRELEDFSYKEIANLVGVPVGTVMSRLARARKSLQQGLGQRLKVEVRDDLR